MVTPNETDIAKAVRYGECAHVSAVSWMVVDFMHLNGQIKIDWFAATLVRDRCSESENHRMSMRS